MVLPVFGWLASAVATTRTAVSAVTTFARAAFTTAAETTTTAAHTARTAVSNPLQELGGVTERVNCRMHELVGRMQEGARNISSRLPNFNNARIGNIQEYASGANSTLQFAEVRSANFMTRFATAASEKIQGFREAYHAVVNNPGINFLQKGFRAYSTAEVINAGDANSVSTTFGVLQGVGGASNSLSAYNSLHKPSPVQGLTQ